MGELHLEILVDRMLREFRVDANVGKPQVAYRETIKNPVAKVEDRYVRQTGGRGQYGHVVLDLEPTGPGGGYEFVDKITGGIIPKEYIPSVDAGIQEAMRPGVLAGYPIVDMRATLVYGSYHDVDCSEMAFKIAGSIASRRPAARPTRSCWSRSWPSRWSPPRTTWATSSATCRPGAARSRAWSSGATRRSSAPRCRWPRCSGTLPIFGRAPRGGRPTRMQFHSYQEVPESVSKEIVARVRGE